MRKLLVFMLPIMLGFTVQAQTLEEVIQSYAEVNGTAEAWNQVKTMQMKGEFAQMGMKFPLTTTMARPGKIYTEINVMGQVIKQGYDGNQAWMVNPLMGKATAEVMSEEDAKDIKEQGDFEDELLSYKEKGHKAELVGSEEIEGTPCFKIKIVKKNGEEVIKFIDKENFLTVMSRTVSTNAQMKGAVVETYFSDYKEVGDGLLMWYSMKTKISGQEAGGMTINSIELNIPVDDNIFALPK